MGQAFRRAGGRQHRTTSLETPSPSPSPSPTSASRIQNTFDQRPPVVNAADTGVHVHDTGPTLDGNSEGNIQTPEQKDSSEVRNSDYEAMLNQMVGRISTKPGGKLEMGEAFVARKSSRAMPKLRNTSRDTGRYEERPVAAGTLNVAQLRHILRLHQGIADGHDGSVGPKEISEMFRLDPAQVERIFHSVSIPAEDNTRQKKDEH